jgi:predicted heme/steroid binding protein
MSDLESCIFLKNKNFQGRLDKCWIWYRLCSGPSELRSDPKLPIYVAVKGTVFNTSAKREMYGQGGSNNVFAGKDASRGLEMSSLEPENYSILNEEDMKALDDRKSYFEKLGNCWYHG